MTLNSQGKEQIRILFADDDDAFRTALKGLLSASGYLVEDCESGSEAIELLSRQAFDIAILDHKMPEVTGLNVLQWMYEQKLETPVIMLTAEGSETVAVEAMKLGAYDYVRKEQIDINHLPVIINGVYERYSFRKEKERRELIERERAASLMAVESFHSTLATLAQIVNDSLSAVAGSIDQTMNELVPHVSSDQQQRFVRAFMQLRQNYSIVSSAVRSMLQAANSLHGNFSDSQYAPRARSAREPAATPQPELFPKSTDSFKR